MTVKMSISLTDQQAEYARKQVAEGRFSSTSAVIQQALEAKRSADEEYEAWKTEFGATMRERLDGEFRDQDNFRKRIETMIERKEAAVGLVDQN